MAASIAASLALHALAVALASLLSLPNGERAASEAMPDEDDDGGREELVHVDIDIEEPPEAPEAHAPEAPEDPATVEPSPPDEPSAELVAEPPPPDAGAYEARSDAALADPPPDAGVAIDASDAGAPGEDAQPPDAGAPRRDAGPTDPVYAAETKDAGPAADDATPPADAGAAELAAASAAVAAAEGDGDGEPPPPGAAADLARYAPEDDVLTLLLRLDRLRGTPWEDRVRAILEPMPDYRAIIGGRDIALTDHLDLLLISSHRPESVTATTLAAKSRDPAEALRELLNHEGAPVSWRERPGGTLGERRAGANHHPADPRVYVLPSELENWLVLAHPDDVDTLVTPSGDDPELPGWLAASPELAAEAGAGSEPEDGPMAVVSASGFSRTLRVPGVGGIPAPHHLAAAIEIDPQGFRLRGTLTFEDEERAREFEEIATRELDDFLAAPYGRAILRQMNAYNAARGLSLSRVGRRIGYATSVSVADGRAALDFAAAWTARYFRVPNDAPDDGDGNPGSGRP